MQELYPLFVTESVMKKDYFCKMRTFTLRYLYILCYFKELSLPINLYLFRHLYFTLLCTDTDIVQRLAQGISLECSVLWNAT